MMRLLGGAVFAATFTALLLGWGPTQPPVHSFATTAPLPFAATAPVAQGHTASAPLPPPPPLPAAAATAAATTTTERFRLEHARLARLYGTAIGAATRVNIIGQLALRTLLLPIAERIDPLSAPSLWPPWSPVDVAVTGGSATAGACVGPNETWPALLRRRLVGLLHGDTARSHAEPRRVRTVNAAQGATDTRRPTQFLHALFAPGAGLVAWEFAINDKTFEPNTPSGADALRLAHDMFARRVIHAHPDAALVWVFLWDDMPKDRAAPTWTVERESAPVRRAMDGFVPQVEVSLARLVANWTAEGADPHTLTCDGAHPNARGHAVVADLVTYALADAVLAQTPLEDARSALAQWDTMRAMRAEGEIPLVGSEALRRIDPPWFAEYMRGRARPRGFPFKMPLHAGGAYERGEQVMCTHKAFEWEPVGQRGWVPLQFDTLGGFLCAEFTFYWTGYAYDNRADRQAVLEVPDCAHGNVTLRFPYAVLSLPSFPCGDARVVCAVQRGGGDGGDGAPWVRQMALADIAPREPVSVCAAYPRGTSARDRVYLRELFVVEDCSAQ